MACLGSLFIHIHILEHVVFFALHNFIFYFIFLFLLISVLHIHCINFVFYFQFSL
jgi:hypothetical protein